MTREEAIYELLNAFKYNVDDSFMDACDKAIEALSVEPCDKDAISREGLLKSWEELSPRGRTEFDQVIMTIPALPSAELANLKQEFESAEPSDCISRADAMGTVQDHFNDEGFKGYDDGQKMLDRIKALPSVDRPTGRWIRERLVASTGGSYSVNRCSNCQGTVQVVDYHYCPYCGADMRGGAND